MKKTLCKAALFAGLGLAACLPAAGQVANQIGVAFIYSAEMNDTGNGPIGGVLVQNRHTIRPAGQAITFATDISLTRDLKAYLSQYGTAVRFHGRARWYIAKTGLFLQTGLNASAVRYLDPSGYAKGATQAAAGAGYTEIFPDFEFTAGYVYLFEAGLHAQKGFFDSTGRVLDGWTRGHNLNFETAYVLNKSKWLVIFNLGAQITHYRRNPAVYGPTLGGVDHKSNSIDTSIGIGRRY